MYPKMQKKDNINEKFQNLFSILFEQKREIGAAQSKKLDWICIGFSVVWTVILFSSFNLFEISAWNDGSGIIILIIWLGLLILIGLSRWNSQSIQLSSELENDLDLYSW